MGQRVADRDLQGVIPNVSPASKPLRIGIQGWGSEGDIRPLIALAARLRQEGHDSRRVLTQV
jgi:hypothetical protein